MTTTDTTTETTTTVGIEAATFVRCVANAALFASADRYRPVLTCVKIDVTGGEAVAKFTATDSYGLIVQPVELVDGARESATALVDAKELLAVAKDVKAAKVRGDIALIFAAGTLTITYGVDTYRRVLRCDDGTFPSVESIIPKDWATWTGATFAMGTKAMARLAKLDGNITSAVTGQPVEFHSTTPAKPVVVTVGDAWVLHMPVKVAAR